MIDITLVLERKELDIVIPDKITFGRLKCLLFEALQEAGVKIPVNSHLAVKDKILELGEYDFVSDFGIANGDRIEILVEKTDADI